MVVTRVDRGGEDIDVVFGKNPGHIREKPRPVQSFDLDVDEEDAALGGRPLHLNHALRVLQQGGDIAAILAMHADARAPGDETHNRITGNRSATPGQLHENIRSAPHENS